MQHRIAILTSVFNGDKFLEGFLSDIEKQTIFDQCVLCLVNCGQSSSDDMLCRQFLAKHPSNVRLFIPDSDPGIYGAWNICIHATATEYITNANIDDRLSPTCLEEQAYFLDHNPNIDLVYTKTLFTRIANEDFEQARKYRRPVGFTGVFSKDLIKRSCLPHNHPMWRRTLHDKNGLFDNSFKSAGDYEFWLRCVENGSEFARLNKVLGVYYVNPRGMSTDVTNASWRNQEVEKVQNRYCRK